jgi:hypothetical protein
MATLMSNPLQTELLIFGTCCPDDFPDYEWYFDETYRRGPIRDRFGRRVVFHGDSARHICFAESRHDKSDPGNRDVWRPDRAMRMPWIKVALTDRTALLKENKDLGRQGYLIRMQLGSQIDYYQVVVKTQGKTDVIFKTAYSLDHHQWAEAMNRKTVRLKS